MVAGVPESPITFRAFGVTVAVRSPRGEVAERVRALLPPTAEVTETRRARLHFTLDPIDTGDGKGHWQVGAHGRPLCRTASLDDGLRALEGEMRLAIAARAPRRVFLHAGAVGWKGRAVLLPGRTLAGKSTLVAALVRAGAAYLSDEYAVIDRHGLVHPYARPLGLRPRGSLRAQPVNVGALGGEAGSVALEPGLIVACRYQEGARLSFEPLTPGAAALALLDNAVPARIAPRRVVPVVGEVARRARAFQGVRGEADEAARAILSLAEMNPAAL